MLQKIKYFLSWLWCCKIGKWHLYSTPFSQGVKADYKIGASQLEIITIYCDNIKMTCELCGHEFGPSKELRERLLSKFKE